MFVIPFPTIDPVAIDLGFISVYWYGLSYLVGISLAWIYARKLAPHFNITLKQVDDFITWEVIGIVVGGRLGYVLFYDFSHFIVDPFAFFYTRQGGMSFHGGFLGVVIATIFYCRKYKVPMFTFGDILGVIAPVGLLWGRLANFVNAEHYGRPTDVSWAMIFPKSDGVARHPSQLYEAFGEGILLAFLMYICFVWLSNQASKRKYPGFLSGAFMIGYGAIRFVIEYFRNPDGMISVVGVSISYGQLLCVPMIIAGLVFVFFSTRYKLIKIN